MDYRPCKNNCTSPNGMCVLGKCLCGNQFTGDDCIQP